MPKQEGRNMIMVVSPSKKFTEQLAKDRERGGDEPEAPEPDLEAPAEPETVAPMAAEPAAEPDEVTVTEVEAEPVEVPAAENEG